jgi:N-methylhydantoinase A
VCLLWSVVNGAHERRVGEILAEEWPQAAVTLSHQLNPAIREFRRASASAIDASLKPLMGRYLGSLSERLAGAGFGGTLLVLTSQGSMVPAHDVAAAPIRAINSGPSLAPVAGRHFGLAVAPDADIIVADTGGTTYDVSLVRGGTIPLTRDAWIGAPYRGHLTGFPSVDVQSVGAGGGSIAHVDAGGLLGIGPRSAGSQPGPACYGRGGTEPTLTDACLVLGYLDPSYFLGGRMPLDRAAAEAAIERHVARPLGLSIEAAAAAIVALGTENMVQAIVDITVTQGIDPKRSVLIGGGGAAGLNSVFIARRLGIPTLVIPELGATLSAGGALMSEMAADFRAIRFMTTADFDIESANGLLADLGQLAQAFLAGANEGAIGHRVAFAIEARYEQQVWEIDVALPFNRIADADDVAHLAAAFHAAHEAIFGFRDSSSAVEIIGWSARASYRTGPRRIGRVRSETPASGDRASRLASFPGRGAVLTAVLAFEEMAVDARHAGPAVVETPFSSIVIDPDCHFYKQDNGSLVIELDYPEAKP